MTAARDDRSYAMTSAQKTAFNAGLVIGRHKALLEAADVAEAVATRLLRDGRAPRSRGADEVMGELRRMAEAFADPRKAEAAGQAGKAVPETLHGHLDRQAKTWTHATGHVMDLSHGWQDCEGRHWHWDDGAGTHPVNGPYMRAAAYGLREPLDVILAAWGPIKPVLRHCIKCDASYLAGMGPWCSTACKNGKAGEDE